MEKYKIGIIGCGDISDTYINTINKADWVQIECCSDIDFNKAKEKCNKYNIKNIVSPKELFKRDSIDLILNLTPPKFHAEIIMKCINNGKKCYTEKPLATNLEDGKKIIELAQKKDIKIGAAPDTFVSSGIQTCRKLIDDGWIGNPIGGAAFMMNHGPESRHPDPGKFYQNGAGPLFDMGPYYLTTLIFLLGPVLSVQAHSSKAFPKRKITSSEKFGQKIDVEVPTHVVSILEFKNNISVNMVTSFDIWKTDVPDIEIYGTEGTISVPNPDFFNGEARLCRKGNTEWEKITGINNFNKESRGIGLLEMIYSIKNNKNHMANIELSFHVLEVMEKIIIYSEEGKRYKIESSCKKPDSLKKDIDLDDLNYNL